VRGQQLKSVVAEIASDVFKLANLPLDYSSKNANGLRHRWLKNAFVVMGE
jgi:hypothetical protein